LISWPLTLFLKAIAAPNSNASRKSHFVSRISLKSEQHAAAGRFTSKCMYKNATRAFDEDCNRLFGQQSHVNARGNSKTASHQELTDYFQR
jgi:hypothetical protein